MTEPAYTPLMEATRRGIPVTSLGDDDVTYGYLALGHHNPTAALYAMALLDADLYGELLDRYGDLLRRPFTPPQDLLDRTSLCWARFPPCECGTGDEDDCHHVWEAVWPVDADADGALAVTVLDLTAPTTRRPDQGTDPTETSR
ncbi:hypothetical protein [Embleya sp. NPDC005971]|uniref:hypothetical protein n=1 Tax=Embleya sp. NPDC005971 TaxID=3156724 RepID=UPI0033E79D4D